MVQTGGGNTVNGPVQTLDFTEWEHISGCACPLPRQFPVISAFWYLCLSGVPAPPRWCLCGLCIPNTAAVMVCLYVIFMNIMKGGELRTQALEPEDWGGVFDFRQKSPV